MSQPAFIKIVETDEKGNEKPVAGLLGLSLGNSDEALDTFRKIVFFMKFNNLNNFEDSKLFAFRIIEDLGISIDEDDIDNLQEEYPDEVFEYSEYSDGGTSLFFDEDDINSNYEKYKDGSAASINITDKIISFGIIIKWTKNQAEENGCMARNIFNAGLPINIDKLSFTDFDNLCYFVDYNYHDNFYLNDDDSVIYNFRR